MGRAGPWDDRPVSRARRRGQSGGRRDGRVMGQAVRGLMGAVVMLTTGLSGARRPAQIFSNFRRS